MAAPRETEQGHELSDLAPTLVRCHSPFLAPVRTALARPLPPIPELPSSSSNFSLPSPVFFSSSSSPSPSPEPTPDTLNACYVCLARKDPGSLLRGDPSDPRFPLAFRCLDCAGDGGLDVGRRHQLVSGQELWVCRWCGGAVPLLPSEPESWDGVEFHRDGCRAGYARALRDHWLTLVMQWFLVLVVGLLCFGRFLMVEEILEGFFVFFVATCFSSLFGFLRFRGRKVYQGPLLMEANRLMALTGTLYYVVRATFYDMDGSTTAAATPEDGSVDEASEDDSFWVSSNAATLTMLLLVWLLFHALFSCIGHMIVFYEWKWWRRMRPGMGFWRRVLEGFMFKMVIWADPYVVEQGFHPHWWRGLWRVVRVFRRRREGLPR
ncbi:hypothetical protein M440DRAFT_8291 [Trichoderma longibrachiatum ATCC 18648]|uniref:Uncharacterized protein n=1 Tax=Trichoderma longibrachiatum ATCC 18648 TaxID=983965 RepID=A0A2T4BRU0_TRILO|nr:hypothetical protein M440DRAFT_8291 [Trichoderma longibrachiatum ATCC 18648]